MASALNGKRVAPDTFRERMELQCREIEAYRQRMLNDTGRELTIDDAAREWIERYAADFACDYLAPPAAGETNQMARGR